MSYPGHSLGEVLPLYRDAVTIFCSPCRLGHRTVTGEVLLLCRDAVITLLVISTREKREVLSRDKVHVTFKRSTCMVNKGCYKNRISCNKPKFISGVTIIADCVWKKIFILEYAEHKLLNKRRELIAKCKHVNRGLLCHLPHDPD